MAHGVIFPFKAVGSILLDGQWHSAVEMHEKLKNRIPPEVALRRAIFEREGTPSFEAMDFDARIRAGVWRIVQYSLAKMKYQGLIDGRGKGIKREYCLTELGKSKLNGIANAKATAKE